MASKPTLSAEDPVENMRLIREHHARSRAEVERCIASLRRIAAALRARGR